MKSSTFSIVIVLASLGSASSNSFLRFRNRYRIRILDNQPELGGKASKYLRHFSDVKDAIEAWADMFKEDQKLSMSFYDLSMSLETSPEPSVAPSFGSEAPTSFPSLQPTVLSSEQPTMFTSVEPTLIASEEPSVSSEAHSQEPSTEPTNVSQSPSQETSIEPTLIASEEPSVSSEAPFQETSTEPTNVSQSPSQEIEPTLIASEEPTAFSEAPSAEPSQAPLPERSQLPTISAYSSNAPSNYPTVSAYPSVTTSAAPSAFPTKSPSATPTAAFPTSFPSNSPTALSTDQCTCDSPESRKVFKCSTIVYFCPGVTTICDSLAKNKNLKYHRLNHVECWNFQQVEIDEKCPDVCGATERTKDLSNYSCLNPNEESLDKVEAGACETCKGVVDISDKFEDTCLSN